jgi:hypothetical protein
LEQARKSHVGGCSIVVGLGVTAVPQSSFGSLGKLG